MYHVSSTLVMSPSLRQYHNLEDGDHFIFQSILALISDRPLKKHYGEVRQLTDLL